jgi:hypothetical protein
MVRYVAPVAWQAFLDYRFNAITLTALEIDAMKNGGEIQTNNATEKREWENKSKLLQPRHKTREGENNTVDDVATKTRVATFTWTCDKN